MSGNRAPKSGFAAEAQRKVRIQGLIFNLAKMRVISIRQQVVDLNIFAGNSTKCLNVYFFFLINENNNNELNIETFRCKY